MELPHCKNFDTCGGAELGMPRRGSFAGLCINCRREAAERRRSAGASRPAVRPGAERLGPHRPSAALDIAKRIPVMVKSLERNAAAHQTFKRDLANFKATLLALQDAVDGLISRDSQH